MVRIIAVTGDNGLPFPRAKANLYDNGTHVPLAVRWGAKVKGGRTVDDFISLPDLAPTFLQATGVEVPAAMTARSFLDILSSTREGRVDARRERVFTGRERHTIAQPDGPGGKEDALDGPAQASGRAANPRRRDRRGAKTHARRHGRWRRRWRRALDHCGWRACSAHAAHTAHAARSGPLRQGVRTFFRLGET